MRARARRCLARGALRGAGYRIPAGVLVLALAACGGTASSDPGLEPSLQAAPVGAAAPAALAPRSAAQRVAAANAAPPHDGIYYALGDSVANNVEVAGTSGSYPALLGADLVMKTINLAVPGDRAIAVLDDQVPEIASPCGLVTLQVGGPDLIDDLAPAASVEPTFALVYERAKVACPDGTVMISTYINNAAQPAVHENIAAYNAWLRTFAKQNAASLEDVAEDDRFNDPPFPSALMYNWMHPNKAGMKLVAEDWYSRIESLNVRL